MEKLIEARSIKKYFATPYGNLHAVDDVSFSLDKGETLGVVGESGCGKSTLGKTILRLLPHTAGELWFDGEDILKLSENKMKRVRAKLQMIFQDPHASLNPRMTIFQIIAEPLIVIGKMKGSQLNNKVYELMETVGLSERLINSYPHELDGGRKQRACIARALALDPKFIVCDEPVSALDVSIQAQILNLLMDLQEMKGISYLFITHDLSVVKHISDYIAVMYLGEVIEYGKTDDIFENPMHPYTKALLTAIPVPDIEFRDKETEIISGELKSPINPEIGCRFAPRCPFVRQECSNRIPVVTHLDGHQVKCIQYSQV
jgi:peptide/nickel transport system ATP-binding protein